MAGQESRVKCDSSSSANARPFEQAVKRLARVGALHTLVRGGLPLATQKRLLKDAVPKRAARQLPSEVWASLAASIAAESPIFALALGQALHDHLGWDQEPTATTPHVSLSPDHTAEIRRIVEGTVDNPRLARFLSGPMTP